MEIRRCMSCMREYQENEAICPRCKNTHGWEEQIPYALRIGTILNGKYLVGKVIGQGGFGITYVGCDLVLNKKVAIKEFYPMSTGAVSRNGPTSSRVYWNTSASMGRFHQDGYASFLKEARKMAKLDDIPGVVAVRDLFSENETAYIVMSFVEGETLKARLFREGAMPFDRSVTLLLPVITALTQVHQMNVIHRDISPDNIMLDPLGNVWVLDLGAAKDLDVLRDSAAQSSQLVTKQGFSPIEQYMAGANIGPWTDVYAMCATIYYCVTGKMPPAAPNRMFADELTCQAPLTREQFAILQAGMAVNPAERTRDMGTLLAQLKKSVEPAKAAEQPVTEAEIQKRIAAAVEAARAEWNAERQKQDSQSAEKEKTQRVTSAKPFDLSEFIPQKKTEPRSAPERRTSAQPFDLNEYIKPRWP